MSLVAQCLRGSGPVPRSKIRFRLKARENKVRRSRGVVRCNCAVRVSSALLTSLLFMPAQVLGPLQPNNARSEGLNGTPSADSTARVKRTKAEPEAAEPTKGKGKAAKAKPAPQPGRWLDRDCNAALNMQRIGESRWRPLELCYWPDQGALPAKGKEYPGLGYKRLRDKPPKAQQQQAPPI
ncbi:hypothetical protein QJQ45_026827 [Haematococcus lacustris]|nr:hypothetical protein QJQ45_026827 [Haematococcus lacustris]